MNPLLMTRLVCVLALALTMAVRGLDAQERSFDESNCALTPPPGWQPLELKGVPGIIAAFSEPHRTRTLMILAEDRGKAAETLNDASVVDFDKGVEKSGGGPKTSGKFVQFAGFETYERRGTVEVKGKHLTTLALTIPTGDGIYILEALASKNEAGDDEEIRQSINSFRFLHPPGQPRQPQSASYRAGYLSGQLLAGCVFVGLIIWAVVRAVSRRTPSVPAGFSGPYPHPHASFPPPPAAPPPLPPTNPTTPPHPPPPPPY